MKVLCYSPYNLWTLHGLWELTVLQAARLRGAEVDLVHCDGLFSDCDLYWAATVPRDPEACMRCQAHVAGLSSRLRLPYRWLGRYVSPEEIARARRWSSELPASGLCEATLDELPVGAWVRSSVHSHLRRADLDLADPAVERTYRSYLTSGAVASLALARLLESSQPDVLFLISGRLSSTRVALELARRRGIRVVCHERGTRDESLLLYENTHCHAIAPIRRMWDDWGEVPLTREELERIRDYLAGRARGRDLGWHAFNPPPQQADELRTALRLSKERRVFALFTGSDDEVIASPEWGTPFGRQSDWIERSVTFARAHPELDLVIRTHPNTAGAKANGENRVQLEALRALECPPNVRLVEPDAEVSSYTLMELASVGLVFNSTVAWEMAAQGKPVVLAAGSLASGLPFVRTVRRAADYEPLLESLARLPRGHREPESARLALRFAYGFYFRYTVPFPLVAMPDAHNGELRYQRLEELGPGRCPHLDRVLRVLLEAEPVCPPPSAAEAARSSADELEQVGGPRRAPLAPRAEALLA